MAIGLAMAWAASAGVASAQDEVAVKGRAVLSKYKGAVVTIQAVLKTSFSMPGFGSEANETKSEATGTVISASGLTVMALSSIDPSAMMQGMGGVLGSGFTMDAQVQDVKILLEDGTEVASEVVLRDKEWDLAFIRPQAKPAADMVAANLEDSATIDVLDQVIALNRLGRVARRVHSASVERIDAVVERPRRFYIPGNDNTTTGLGSPAFSLDGKLIGVFVMRALQGVDAADMSDDDSPVSVILLPASEILEVSKQIPPK
jgi:S1-C subfamily serine protease